MSRTVRRKTRKISPSSWVLRDWNDRIGFMYYAKHDQKSVEGKKAIARYRSDAGVGDLWYKSRAGWAKYYERRNIRRACDQALHQYFNGFNEEAVMPTFKRGWLD